MKKFLLLGCFAFLFLQAYAQEPNDCVNAITVCGNGTFMSNATGIGNEQEVAACSGFEHNSLWIKVDIVQAGTLGFDLIPDDPDILVDYDFWVYGPNKVCSNLGDPIRCATTNPNLAGLPNNNTGINGSTTLTQTGPGASGNGYVYWLNVAVGESYYIAIDRPVGDGGFQIEWTGTATAGGGAFPAPPEVNDIENLKTCSGVADVGLFDLSSVQSSITSDLVNNDIQFYANLADATDAVNPLPTFYVNTQNPQEIYARVTSGASSCYSLIDFDLIVYPVPDATLSVSENSVCEGETVTFTINGTPGSTVNYNIDGGANTPVVIDASGATSFTQIIYATTTVALSSAQIVNNNNVIACSQPLTDSEIVTVNSSTIPTITTNSPICEGEDAIIEFTGGDANASITYHIDTAASETFSLDASGNYTLILPSLAATSQVTIETLTNSVAPFCVSTLNDMHQITVNSLPTVVAPVDLVLCSVGTTANFDLDAESASISNNEAGVTVTYYESQAEAETGNVADALISPYTSTSANQEIYVRVENASGCVDFTTLTLRVENAPTANTVTALSACDSNNLGFGTFDLTTTSANITAGNTQAVNVSFHILQANAQAGTPQITTPSAYTNSTAYNETIYVRVASVTTDCYTVIALDLEVFDTPTIANLQDVAICDDDQDGFGIFDLTAQNSTIIGTQDPTLHTISFYESQTNALQSTGAISNPSSFQNTVVDGQNIWVRLTHNTSGCYAVSSFNISTGVPLALETSYTTSVCDSDGDGTYIFNLLDENSAILANATNPSLYEVTYYPTAQNAIDDVNAITTPNNYSAVSNPQEVLGVRVTSIASGCWETTTLTLDITVLPDPTVISITPMQLCDETSPFDGTEFFNLTSAQTTIGASVANLSYSYHTSMTDANSALNPISNPSNFASASTTVYIRVTSAVAANPSCFAVFPLQLIVQPLPVIISDSISVCSPIVGGFYDFDLLAQTNAILGSTQSPSDYSVAFYEDAAAAIQITNNPYTNTVGLNQTIYVKITNLASGCSSIFPYYLIITPAATATMPDTVNICDVDGDNDGYSSYDLTTLNPTILNGQNPADYTVTYYINNINAINGVNAISNPEDFENTTAYNQTVYVRVINNDLPTQCFATTSVGLVVHPILRPEITSVDGNHILCVDYTTGIVQNEIVLESDLQDANYNYTWYLDGVEIVGATQATYTIDTAAPGAYTLLISEITSVANCPSQISYEFDVVQSGQAALVAVAQTSSFHPNPTITVTVNGYGTYWYQLDNGDILNNGGVFTNVNGGLHTVTVYDMTNNTPVCDALVIDNIRIIDYPKFFTPNGDGYNDFWNINALSGNSSASISIFDRYGKLLSVINPSTGYGWDGRYNGKLLPASDYWFVVVFEELGSIKEFKAHFSIKY